MNPNNWNRLLDAYITDRLKPSELQTFLEEADRNEASFNDAIEEMLRNHQVQASGTEEQRQRLLKQILERKESIQGNTVHRLRWLRWVAAAVLILIIGSGIYYFNNQSYTSHKSSQITVQTTAAQEIPPGTNRAILTFSNGTQKQLSSADNGLQLKSDALLLTTPNGGQYQAVLPDGSKVWLNAASSIKFPSTFTNKERRVEITGEVYFEIAKDAFKPFKVTTARQEVEVLGTSFNINAYENEESIHTTLLEGSIKVNGTLIKPGQQAIVRSESIRIQPANTEKVIAWKNGLFDFNDLPFDEIMRQLERWYDIKVEYENNNVPNKRLAGKMTRGVSLNDLLKQLGKMGIHYKLNNRTLIVSSS